MKYKPGDIIQYGPEKETWVVLEYKEKRGKYLLLKETLLESQSFGPSNVWKKSGIKRYLNTVYKEYLGYSGKVSMLSLKQYGKYKEIIKPHKEDRAYWIRSPYSNYSLVAMYVYAGGYVNYGNVDDPLGVRPTIYLTEDEMNEA